jgi:S1-C subfamily serine protease
MGNSGGPLLDSEGQLIGMNTMIYSPSGSSAGIGFAVPYTAIKRVVPQIIRTGKAEQVGLGISIVSDDIAKRNKIKGVIIMSVSPGSPAEKAGLLGISETNSGIFINDIIVGIDEHPVTNYDSLYNALDAHKPGDVVQVKILRKGEPKTVPVKLTVLK